MDYKIAMKDVKEILEGLISEMLKEMGVVSACYLDGTGRHCYISEAIGYANELYLTLAKIEHKDRVESSFLFFEKQERDRQRQERK